MRVIAMVAAVVCLAQGVASACGAWSMEDKQRGFHVGFDIASGAIVKGDKRLGALYFDTDRDGTMRTAADHKVIFDIKNGKLRKYGQTIATVEGQTVTFGKHAYTISLGERHIIHDTIPAWHVTVSLGDDVVIDGPDAWALCTAMRAEKVSDRVQEHEIMQRMIFYLAWRETGP